ncbi:response regulator transcription factor [Clostridiaceae bacterium M8S5]|nr:response regulator transcription factor [Clostridiaceae bacterium M8S5]
MKIRILVADDEKNIADPISYALEREGYDVDTVYNGKDAVDALDNNKYCILVLDIMMPECNGYDVCRHITNKNIGIIMLTAKNSTIDKVLGLELGADDYVTKPFVMTELIARIRSLDRRLNKSKSLKIENRDVLIFDSLRLDSKEHTVTIDDINIDLKPKEFELLFFLAKNNKTLFTRDNILDSVWGFDYYGGTRTVDLHIQRIRKKLQNYSTLIKTIPKVGYKFIGENNAY